MDNILKQIDEVENWLREHPDAHPVAIGEMISRLRELNNQLQEHEN